MRRATLTATSCSPGPIPVRSSTARKSSLFMDSHDVRGARSSRKRHALLAEVLDRLQTFAQPHNGHRDGFGELLPDQRVFLVDGDEPDDQRQHQRQQQRPKIAQVYLDGGPAARNGRRRNFSQAADRRFPWTSRVRIIVAHHRA